MRSCPVSARDGLVVALDLAGRSEALAMVERLREHAGMFKVGKQLFTREGPELVREMVAAGHRVFLDLKFHDIPSTVAGAVAAATALDVDLLTVHATGGEAMLRAAARAAAGSRAQVLAVTVLTSLDERQLRSVGFAEPPERLVLRLARLALECGLDGVVAPPTDVAGLRQELGRDFLILTPGVRLDPADRQDQARVATPAEAIRAGADYIVVGRPITQAADPAAVAARIVKMLE